VKDLLWTGAGNKRPDKMLYRILNREGGVAILIPFFAGVPFD